MKVLFILPHTTVLNRSCGHCEEIKRIVSYIVQRGHKIVNLDIVVAVLEKNSDTKNKVFFEKMLGYMKKADLAVSESTFADAAVGFYTSWFLNLFSKKVIHLVKAHSYDGNSFLSSITIKNSYIRIYKDTADAAAKMALFGI